MKKNSLYGFVLDNLNNGVLFGDISEIKSSSPDNPRQAVYLNLAIINPAKENGWVLHEQHITIDALYDTQSAVLSPCHLTRIYCLESNPSMRCVVHIYFDRYGYLNGKYDSKLDTSLLKSSDANPEAASTNPVEQIKTISLDLPKIYLFAEKAKTIIGKILNKKMETYQALYGEIAAKDQTLTELLYTSAHTTRVEWQNALDITSDCLHLIEQMNRYSDNVSSHTNMMSYLSLLKGTLTLKLEQQEQLEQPPSLAVKSENEERTFSPITVPTIYEPEKVQTEISAVTVEQKYQILMDKIQWITQLSEVELYTQQGVELQEIRNELLIIELTSENKVDKEFAKRQLALLPSQQKLVDRFERAVMDGNLGQVIALFPYMDTKKELILVFNKLYQSIVDGDHEPEIGAQKIAVADYFYAESELYRAYLFFQSSRMRTVNFTHGEAADTTSRYLSDDLIYTYLKRNRQAFTMLLKQQYSPAKMSLFDGKTALNALQSLLILYAWNPDNFYINSLFEHNAVVESGLGDVQVLALPIKDKLQAKRPQGTLFAPKPALSDLSLFDERVKIISALDNLLTAARLYNNNNYPALMKVIAEHAPLKIILENFMQHMWEDWIEIDIIPYKEGGATLCRSIDEFRSRLTENELSNKPNKFAQLHLFFSVLRQKCLIVDTKLDNFLETAQDLFTAFLSRFQQLSDPEKRQFMQTFIFQTAKEDKRASAKHDVKPPELLYNCALLCCSLISNFENKDYIALMNITLHCMELAEARDMKTTGNSSVYSMVANNIMVWIEALPNELQTLLKARPAYLKLDAKIRDISYEESAQALYISPPKNL